MQGKIVCTGNSRWTFSQPGQGIGSFLDATFPPSYNARMAENENKRRWGFWKRLAVALGVLFVAFLAVLLTLAAMVGRAHRSGWQKWPDGAPSEIFDHSRK